MEIGETAERCPHCGYSLADFQGISCGEKFLMALHHPIRENRMMAIRILGDLKSQQAVQAFGDLPDRETDYYLICEVVVALGKIGGPQSLRRIKRLRSYTSRMVRKLSGTALGGASVNPNIT